MLPAKSDRTPARGLRGLVALLLLVPLALGPATARADDVRTDSALAIVPADAAFYTAMLRNKEQIDIVLKSKAFKKLMALQGVQDGLKMLQAELKKGEGPWGQIQKALEDKDNQALIEVLTDAASNEIFVYGGGDFNGLITAYFKANNANSLGTLQALTEGGADAGKANMRAMLQSLQKNKEMLKFPDLVIGFKVSDAKKVNAQIDRLEKLAEGFFAAQPPFKGKFKKDANGVLTLSLEGSMLPWDDFPVKDYEEKAGEFDDLVKHLKKMTGTVSLGVHGDYLLLAVTSTVKDLEKLGKKGKKLADHPDLKLLAGHAKKPITSVNYTSKGFLKALTTGNDISELNNGLKKLLEKADIPEARKKAIQKDMDALAADLKKLSPEVGSSFSVHYMVEDGYEGYSYSLSPVSDKVKGARLKVLDHFGGNPIFAAGVAMSVDGSGYKALVQWVKTIYGHLEAIALDKAPPEGKDEYAKWSKIFFPLLEKLNKTTAELFLPSIKEGALGIVLDAKWKSKKWVKAPGAPEFDKELPMAELGFLLGLSDADKFTKALKEYRLTFNEIWEKVREASKDNVPEFKLPAPETEKGKGGTLYYYPIPEEAMLDKQVQPTLGIGKAVAVVTLSKGHTERLLDAKPLKGKAPLATKKNLIGVVYFDNHALLDALEPWIDFAATAAGGEDKKQAGRIAKEVKAGFDILRAYHGYASGTYVEDGVTVSHSRTLIKDR